MSWPFGAQTGSTTRIAQPGIVPVHVAPGRTNDRTLVRPGNLYRQADPRHSTAGFNSGYTGITPGTTHVFHPASADDSNPRFWQTKSGYLSLVVLLIIASFVGVVCAVVFAARSQAAAPAPAVGTPMLVDPPRPGFQYAPSPPTYPTQSTGFANPQQPQQPYVPSPRIPVHEAVYPSSGESLYPSSGGNTPTNVGMLPPSPLTPWQNGGELPPQWTSPPSPAFRQPTPSTSTGGMMEWPTEPVRWTSLPQQPHVSERPPLTTTSPPTVPPPPEQITAKVWQTSKAGDMLAQGEDAIFRRHHQASGDRPLVSVTEKRGQKIKGFGGAFTEASADVFSKLSVTEKQHVLEWYFGPSGIGYTVGRVHINSCDFSLGNYAFDDTDGDFDLAHFDDSVTHDAKLLIPFIKAAQSLLKNQDKSLQLLASPWSPPAWMKTSGKMDGSGTPCLKAGTHGTWAKYISRWISAYREQGIPIWAITVQNEPENPAPWEACVMTPEEEGTFIAAHLGPTMKAEHPEILMFAFDHNKDTLPKWAQAIHANPAASHYLAGLAFHWYAGDGFEAVQQARRDYPQAVLLASEATYEQYRWHAGTTIEKGDWTFGEGYAHDIIGDLNAGSIGWIDWNLLLDQHGGPNHKGNSCDAALLADLASGKVYRHPQYYYVGHFSKFILPGATHLDVKVSGSKQYHGVVRPYGTCTEADGIEATASVRPDGAIVIVVLNCGDGAVDFQIKQGHYIADVNIPAHAIQTYILHEDAAQLSDTVV